MARFIFIFSLLVILCQLIPGGEARKFTITNNCSSAVWPVFVSSDDSTIFSLQNQESRVLDLRSSTPFKLWARTNCSTSADGNLTCMTGQCPPSAVNCSEPALSTATTLAEFRLNDNEDYCYYDVSLVDGYNAPIAVVPEGGNGSLCTVTGCVYDVDGECPQELKLGSTCQSPCELLQNPIYCCTASKRCQPTVYSSLFKNACPRAYSYSFDDAASTFICGGSPAFTIIFCPTSSTLIRELSMPVNSSGEPAPAPAAASLPFPRSSRPNTPGPAAASLPFPRSSRPNSNSTKRKKPQMKKSQMPIVVAIAVPTSTAILISVFIGFWILRKKKKAKGRDYAEMKEISSMEPLQFDISAIRAATHNFSIDNKLGEGGFGEVYKGKLESGQEVAVKRLLQSSKQGVTEFDTEVLLVAKLQHKNLVKLLGFCVTSKEKLLVYEFLSNSSLNRFLFDPTRSAPSLDWHKRLNIIIGIARGLMYLHEDSRLKVIHRDLKTSNVLLDDTMNPKISDFGLAKLFGEDQTQGDTKRIVGTYGYMAPEYAITGHYSVKSDVYSFGVIVLEIISGQKNRFLGGLQVEEALLHRAWRLWNEGKELDLVDASLNEDFPPEEVMRCYHIGLLCIQEDAIDRPGMRLILDALNRPSISLPKPKAPRFFGNPVSPDQGHYTHPYTYTGTETITTLYPRD